ncbi:MAG: GntR family transcriptional regulator [Burkholderiales bacterium]|nr:GntR family transcriptional regulator [Burkholderiales bacterium]
MTTQLKNAIKVKQRSKKKDGARGKRGIDLQMVLRERIAKQEIAPGGKLREQELSTEFGVPRALVREVFCALEQRGLIERIPNRGAVVVRLDLSQVFEIYDLREVLEGLCARLATQNSSPESWQDMVDMFEGPMEEYVKRGDYESFLAGYGVFRRRLIEAAANPVLAGMLDSIYEKTQAIIRRIIILPGRAEHGLSEHRAVLAAMRRGDPEEAERLRRTNMRSGKDYLKRYQNFVLFGVSSQLRLLAMIRADVFG